MLNYGELVNGFRSNPRDVITRPTTNRSGKWFYVYCKNDAIYVTNAQTHEESSTITIPRKLYAQELGSVYELYLKRKKGISVSKEAAASTVNQVYWFGIFAELGM